MAFNWVSGCVDQDLEKRWIKIPRMARIGLRQSTTSPRQLADVVLRCIGAQAQWPPIPVNGARLAAVAIARLL